MGIQLHEFTLDHYVAAYSLWKASDGIGLSDADSRENIARFLAHNHGMSFVALEDGRLVGAVLCGSDGRRGYLHHLAVAGSHRRRGIGRALADRSLAALAAAGVRKCHIFVMAGNREGQDFWKGIGWQERTSLVIMSRDIIS
jgi:ribosomal protein S18 acetylase RimI-like enzyme